MVNAYTLSIAVLLLTGAALGDPALWLGAGAVALGAVVALMVPRCKRAPEPPAMPHALPESAR